jgi:hypothetical protein
MVIRTGYHREEAAERLIEESWYEGKSRNAEMLKAETEGREAETNAEIVGSVRP